ncbi:hypothetical protein IPZ58_06945 [Streptomyces roseoverticillatus]|uniref:hypothetical protein n=1 Tax=Streptomyces roseoverticillatus TaxID=66429 RepID=UPI001F1DA3AA|nr:hypothetical protein [Streptomyces roseoverticillatus]MCF3101314.1 hypothetical protein [Streptomyces roseoverticillatus]
MSARQTREAVEERLVTVLLEAPDRQDGNGGPAAALVAGGGLPSSARQFARRISVHVGMAARQPGLRRVSTLGAPCQGRKFLS